MNYLAHARLSFNDPDVLTGNMISDFVKGKKKLDYPDSVQRGIMLHRLIDSFTDAHPVNKEAKEIFRPAYRLYCGAFVDVAYDHFLAIDETEFSGDELELFSADVYTSLETRQALLPAAFSRLFPYMKQHNWLYNYRTKVGIKKSFGGLVHRALYLNESATAENLFERHYQLLQDCYRHFWTELKSYARQEYIRMSDK